MPDQGRISAVTMRSPYGSTARQVLAHLVGHWCAPDQETVDLDLKAGENRLTIKITNGVLDAAFYFALRPHAATADVLAPLWEQLVRDFPAAAQQIAWVRDDGIFSEDAPDPLLPLRRSASESARPMAVHNRRQPGRFRAAQRSGG